MVLNMGKVKKYCDLQNKIDFIHLHCRKAAKLCHQKNHSIEPKKAQK